MWIVRLALRRPFTIAVMALLILVLGTLSLTRMVVDIFPAIDIPVVAVVWSYPGLSAEDMERRVVLISERAYSTTVNGIERVESQSIPGVGVMKVYFQPGTEIGAAIAQIGAVSSTLLRLAPPGMQPPAIIQFSASNVPVAQLTASSRTLPEQQIFDYGLNFIRVRLFTIPGLSTPAPFGGKARQVSIDIDPQALAAKGLSPADVVAALQASNVIVPAGQARVGGTEYNVLLNSSPTSVAEFARIPLRVVAGAPVPLRNVARVADGYAVQTNIVRVNGKRATYLAILKHADASTLAVVDATREALPAIEAVAPQGLELKIDFDQSLFVRAAIVATLSICIVFFPVVLLYGPAKYLFTPLALAVVFAMLASYVLSRTLVPLLARMLLPGEPVEGSAATPEHEAVRSALARLGAAFNRKRDEVWGRFQAVYGRALETVLAHRRFTLVSALVLVLSGAGLFGVVGTDFFPTVDAGLMKLHVRTPPGTRIEQTEQLVEAVEQQIRQVIPPEELETINDMIGVPTFYNLAFVPTDNIGEMDAEILIALKRHHRPTARYMRKLRATLPAGFLGSSFYFQPADIVTQVLNFGVSAPVA